MHQHPRPAPRSASAASDLQTNPARTNNQRDDLAVRPPPRYSPSSGSVSESHSSDPDRPESTNATQAPELQRLNLIVQHFFTKAALIIIASRVPVPPSQNRDGEHRLEKWFNTWISDTNAISQDLSDWKNMDASLCLPPTLTIDFHLDLAQHVQKQALVIVDEDQRRWDVAKSIHRHAKAAGLSDVPTRVVYERWTVSLKQSTTGSPVQLQDAPPNVYKKGVVLLRSLFTYSRFLPGFRFSKRLSRQAGNSASPKPAFSITSGDSSDRDDTLNWSLTDEPGTVTDDYRFNPLPCAFGLLNIAVKYRTNCNFEMDAAERLLSAQIATGSSSAESASRTVDSTSEELGHDSRYKPWSRMPSTGEREDLALRLISSSKSSLRSELLPANVPRRPSVSFQPFKAGSLSSSPGNVAISGSPSTSLGRQVGMIPPSHSRSRSSLNALPQQALRNPGIPIEAAITSSASSSPKPAPLQRYSSSFSNRRARFPSSAGTTKTDEDGSSSRGSVSSAPRGSVALDNETSLHDDSESIGDFLKMLDQSSRQMPSLTRTDPASLAANSQRTVAQFSKFARMKDSTVQLSESISSSLMLHRSSTSSSRQLSNVPGLVSSLGASTGSSPGGKPISPHTPHIPVIPSRLSENSIASYSPHDSRRSDNTLRAASAGTSTRSTGTASRSISARAIDIPNSPRVFAMERRSSSVRDSTRPTGIQFTPVGALDDDLMPFGLRSASLPYTEERNIGGRPTAGSHLSRLHRGNNVQVGAIVDDDDEEEEPLLFDLGELGRESMRRD